jgi:hypothetical protein
MNETENRHCLKTQALPIFCKTEMKSNFSGRKSKNSYSEISKKKNNNNIHISFQLFKVENNNFKRKTRGVVNESQCKFAAQKIKLWNTKYHK